MQIKFYHVALLVWLAGVLDAQRPRASCGPPSLNKGYFLPVKKSYGHETTITYACENRHKPVAEGWWTTSKCLNGKWSPEPQCIEDTACLSPTIRNAKYTKTSDGLYKEGNVIDITCNQGYTHRDHDVTAECIHGKWSSVPTCEKSVDACIFPPKVPNAVIMHQYKEVFPDGSKVEYRCKTGYTTEQREISKSIQCSRGTWDEAPTCSSSTSSSLDEEDTRPSFTSIHRCGKFPVVENSVAEPQGQRSLKYKCVNLYELQGPETVVCHSNRKWSDLPTCRENFCSVDTNADPELKNTGVAFLANGETMWLACEDKWKFENFALFQCKDLQPILSRCCNSFQITTGIC
ncbi:complement factor H-related protein 1-like [Cololabis saira]|uniref:complement factor H-related protein 1-like n=1 Tax=Cololabis saira TaxID=129043 RepID=UPI002AD28F48|nr:complement factor H-related protein 1-like [Cololabis saira]